MYWGQHKLTCFKQPVPFPTLLVMCLMLCSSAITILIFPTFPLENIVHRPSMSCEQVAHSALFSYLKMVTFTFNASNWRAIIEECDFTLKLKTKSDI